MQGVKATNYMSAPEMYRIRLFAACCHHLENFRKFEVQNSSLSPQKLDFYSTCRFDLHKQPTKPNELHWLQIKLLHAFHLSVCLVTGPSVCATCLWAWTPFCALLSCLSACLYRLLHWQSDKCSDSRSSASVLNQFMFVPFLFLSIQPNKQAKKPRGQTWETSGNHISHSLLTNIPSIFLSCCFLTWPLVWQQQTLSCRRLFPQTPRALSLFLSL